MTTDKVMGPASYFPSIEQKYGKPMDYWLNIVGNIKDKKHMEIVLVLKSEYGLGHGHANAIVAHVMASRAK